MPKMPDLSEMDPETWLSEMQRVHGQLVEEFAEIWRSCEGPGAALAKARERLEAYALPEGGKISGPLLSVRKEDGRLVFAHESGSRELAIGRDEDAGWQVVDSDEQRTPRELAERVLALVPWWGGGAFAAKVGRPEDFIE